MEIFGHNCFGGDIWYYIPGTSNIGGIYPRRPRRRWRLCEEGKVFYSLSHHDVNTVDGASRTSIWQWAYVSHYSSFLRSGRSIRVASLSWRGLESGWIQDDFQNTIHQSIMMKRRRVYVCWLTANDADATDQSQTDRLTVRHSLARRPTAMSPNLGCGQISHTWSTVQNFISICSGVLILWRVEFSSIPQEWVSPIRSPYVTVCIVMWTVWPICRRIYNSS